MKMVIHSLHRRQLLPALKELPGGEARPVGIFRRGFGAAEQDAKQVLTFSLACAFVFYR
jgi:hypothetical protein